MKDLINEIIDAWEALEGDIRYDADIIEKWLAEDMAPVINKAREMVGRKTH